MTSDHDRRHPVSFRSTGGFCRDLTVRLNRASVVITLDRYGHLYAGDAHVHVDGTERWRSRHVRTTCGLAPFIRP
jgi:hypothetical protein